MSDSPKYVLGIDGGATKSSCLVADLKGAVVGSFIGPASNPYTVKEFDQVLRTLIQDALRSTNVSQLRLVGACLGLAGAGMKEDQQRIRRMVFEILHDLEKEGSIAEFVNDVEDVHNIIVCGDMVTALLANVEEMEGVIVISGTGSIAYGQNANGETARSGGWGKYLSEEGSGLYIGQRALKAVAQAHDGRGQTTPLVNAIIKEFGADSMDNFLLLARKKEIENRDIASLARIVNDIAQAGDEVSQSILKDAGYELSRCVMAVTERLNLKSGFTLVIAGGVLTNIDMVRNSMRAYLQEKIVPGTVVFPSRDGAYGALKVAKITYERHNKE